MGGSRNAGPPPENNAKGSLRREMIQQTGKTCQRLVGEALFGVNARKFGGRGEEEEREAPRK